MGHHPLLFTNMLCVCVCVFLILFPILLMVKTRTKNNPQRLREVTAEPVELSAKSRTLTAFLPHVVSPQQVLRAPNWGKSQSFLSINPSRPLAPQASLDMPAWQRTSAGLIT